jgi:magnesium transporter
MPEETQNPRPYTELTEKRYEDILTALEEKPQRLRGLLAPLHPADIADLLERLPQRRRESLVLHIPSNIIGDVLAELEEGAQEHLLSILTPEAVAQAVAELESDDTVDIVQHLEESQAEEAAERLDKKEKRLLKYDPDSAGGLMQLELLTALPEQKVGDVLRYLRREADALPDNPGTVFIINDKRKLLGTVSLARLVQCPLNVKLSDVMREKPVSIPADMPSTDIANLFEKYDIHNCAVVNRRGQLLGRVTIDDVLDVVLEQHEREMKRAAGLNEKDDLFAPIWSTTSKRLPWLIINLGTAILASLVIALFQDQIQRLVALAVLMPIVASMGGNAGTQTLTVTVRGLATGQITMKNALLLLAKELLVGSLNGTALALLLAAGVVFIYDDWMLALIIAAATIINHVFAAIAGHLIPLTLKKMKHDPAISSGVLVTTVTDVGGFFVFLSLAALFLL